MSVDERAYLFILDFPYGRMLLLNVKVNPKDLTNHFYFILREIYHQSSTSKVSTKSLIARPSKNFSDWIADRNCMSTAQYSRYQPLIVCTLRTQASAKTSNL